MPQHKTKSHLQGAKRKSNRFYQKQHQELFIVSGFVISTMLFWYFCLLDRRAEQPGSTRSVANITPNVLQILNHDSKAFTQGFAVGQRVDSQTGETHSIFYESTGLHGYSSLREIDIASGTVLRQISIEKELFGEGIAVFGNQIIMLTWRSKRGFIYDVDTFERRAEFQIRTTTGEGWGITYDPTTHLLVVSDGSAFLHFWDPSALPVVRPVKKVLVVDEDGKPVRHLNELEYAHGEILANVWYQDRIARIDPGSGAVVGWVQLNGLIDPYRLGQEDCLNGIAHDTTRPGSLYITGKRWPRAFELEKWR